MLSSHISIDDAASQILRFLETHCDAGVAPLAGNSIWQDRRFIKAKMPVIDDFLHYRMIDVSAVKLLVQHWYPSLPIFEKKENHRALDDILESIAELKYYRSKVFLGEI